MVLRGFIAGILVGAALCATAAKMGQAADSSCTSLSPDCDADKGRLLIQHAVGSAGALVRTLNGNTEDQSHAGSEQERFEGLPTAEEWASDPDTRFFAEDLTLYLAHDLAGDTNTTTNTTDSNLTDATNATANLKNSADNTASNMTNETSHSTANRFENRSSDPNIVYIVDDLEGDTNTIANTTDSNLTDDTNGTVNTSSTAGNILSNMTNKSLNSTMNKSGICATRNDTQATSDKYTIAHPGTPCVFGVDPRDEGEHCIWDEDGYWSLGWCFTAKNGTAIGSCNEHCPLFGLLKILHDEVGQLRKEVRDMKKHEA